MVLALQAEGLRFAYPGGRPLLDNVSFALAAGEILCLLGPNGTGKTTLLRCLLGLERLQAGRVTVQGRDLAGEGPPATARLMAYVPQETAAVFPFLAQDVVLMGRNPHLGFMAGPTDADRRATQDSLARMGIAHLGARRFHELSGGERQMVLVARALAQGSRVLVMDEPCSGLDLGNQVRILGVIRDLARDGYAVLLTSHLPGHAFQLGGLAALLKDGHMQGPASADDLLDAALLGDLYDTPIAVIQAGDGRRVCVPVMPRN